MLKGRKFVIGDIHSHHKQLIEVFERAEFDFEKDTLISLGDLVDRGPNPIEVIETLMQVKNFIHILGNHDEWCLQYLLHNEQPYVWLAQGGDTTLSAYLKNREKINSHIAFFLKAKLFHIDRENRLFVHAGFNPNMPFVEQIERKDILIWDRSLVHTAMDYHLTGKRFAGFSEIFVGHTPTQIIRETSPQQFSNLWMLDTGVYLSGILTLMEIETKEYWQSTVSS
ncbi:MAG: metallophosphoesterase [bacterium]